MKIAFTKLQTNANNISVKYDEAGEHIVNYPIEQIKSNNNEIEFDASYCNNLSNIEISTENGKHVTPTFDVADEYNTLFEYFNGCKTQKWIIDEENFPNFWKKLFAPDYVFSDRLLYNINDPEIGENNSDNYVYTIKNSSSYEDAEGYRYIRFNSGLQAFLQQYPYWNGGIYNLIDGEYKESEDQNVDSGYLRTEYNFSPYTITKEDSYILRTLEVGGTLFYCIWYDWDIYLVDKTVYDNASINDSVFYIMPRYIELFNSNTEYSQYNIIGVQSYYYFKKVSPGTGHYTLKYDSSDKYSFRSSIPNGNEGEGDYEIEFVNGDTSFYADSGYYNVHDEFTNFLSKSTSYTTRNYSYTGIQSAYKVFIKGYNLLENEELSYKVYNLLARIQWYCIQSYYGTFYDSDTSSYIYFPYISYTSFNTNTLVNLYYNDRYDSDTLKNCNSIITLLGSRYVCNMQMYQYHNSLLYLPKGTQIDKDINDGFNDTDITIIMHEEDLPDTITLGYEYPSYLTILPDSVEHNKTITIDSSYRDLEFIDSYGTIKGTYHINGYKPHDTYISDWGKYRVSNDDYHQVSDKVPGSWKSHFIENYENTAN